MTQQSTTDELLTLRAESIQQCCNSVYTDYTGGKQCQDLVQYDSKKLDALYTNASTSIAELTAINETYKEKVTNVLNVLKNQNDNEKILADLKQMGIAEVRKDGQVRISLPCTRAIENTSNIVKYKNSIKEEYKRVQRLEIQHVNEQNDEIIRKEFEDEKTIKIKQLKEIFEKELCQNPRNTGAYSVELYDECINHAEKIWQKIDGLKKELFECEKSIDSHQLIKGFDSIGSQGQGYEEASIHNEYKTYEKYLKALQENRDYLVKEIQDTNTNNKKKIALIPEYQKWKKTIPAFQASLHPGTLVIGGIVTLVRDDLVEIDTGKDFKRIPRKQVLPRVPQNLIPLYSDEAYGGKEY
jgi:hypothetical protein